MHMPHTLPIETPFFVEHRQLDRTPGGSFRPDARLVLMPALRTSGLWAALSPEDFKNLILLLTFPSPNGNCQPTVAEIADAMQVSRAKARSRMARLAQFEWRGRPIATSLPNPGGLDAYAPGRQLLTDEETEPQQPAPSLLPIPAGRESVIAHSRAAYAKSREEVEREIAERMGWGPPAFAGEDPAVADGKRQAFGRMEALGMPREQALDLLARFDLARVECQLAWLAARHAKSPARLLAAAIEGDYEMPPSLRRQTAPPEKSEPPSETDAKELPLSEEAQDCGTQDEMADGSPAKGDVTLYQA